MNFLKAVSDVHVNLVDLVEVGFVSDRANSLKIFETEAALAEYTIRTQQYFPKEDAKAGGLLKFLLRQILDPSKRGPRGHGATRGRRGQNRRHKK